MPRTMYDSNRPSAIPRNAEMVAGYVDGLYEWSAADWAMFPDAVHVKITALGRDHGTVLNLEPNGYWPSDLGVGWVQRARARGVIPTIYLNYRNHLAMVQAAFDRARVERPLFWVAEYNGAAVIPSGCIAKQYAAPEGTGSAKTSGHYDLSIVADYWPGVDAPPESTRRKERYMKLIKGDERPEIWIFEFGVAGIVKSHIPNEYILDVWQTLLGGEDEQGEPVKASIESKPQSYVDMIETYEA